MGMCFNKHTSKSFQTQPSRDKRFKKYLMSSRSDVSEAGLDPPPMEKVFLPFAVSGFDKRGKGSEVGGNIAEGIWIQKP